MDKVGSLDRQGTKKCSTEQRGPATLLQRQPVNNNLTHLNYSVSGLITIENWFRKYVKTCSKLHYTAWPVNRCARAEITYYTANRDGHLLTVSAFPLLHLIKNIVANSQRKVLETQLRHVNW